MSTIFFSKSIFKKKIFQNTIRVPNSLDPDQVTHFVGPDLGPNCLQRLLADDTSRQRVTVNRKVHRLLTLCMLSKFSYFFCHLTTFIKNSFWNTIRVSYYLDPNQNKSYVGPGLGLNCLQRLSADNKGKS